MLKLTLTVLALATFGAYAECPNGCNQHGKCNLYSACECYRNWMGADCSERVCYFGHAFVDTAQGDINSDGVVGHHTYTTQYTNDKTWEMYDLVAHGKGAEAAGSWGQLQGAGNHAASNDLANVAFAPVMNVWDGSSNTAKGTPKNWDEAHFYRECSNKGVCNRQTGQCQCFKGYEGEGCTRTACSNDCSGHGVCERLKDSNSLYEAWDAYKTQQCVCDAGFMGPDCSLRKCPQGDDPVSRVQDTEVQLFGFTPFGDHLKPNNRGVVDLATGSTGGPEDFFGRFALKFTDEFGDSWTTSTLSWPSGPFNSLGLCNGTVGTADGMSGTKYLTHVDPDRKFSATVGATTMACSISTTTEIENALKALPNNVIADVSVSFHFQNSKSAAEAGHNAGWGYKVTFTGNSGNVQPLEVLYEVTQCLGAASCSVSAGTARAYSSQGTADKPTLESYPIARLIIPTAHADVAAHTNGVSVTGVTSGATGTLIDCTTQTLCFVAVTSGTFEATGEELTAFSNGVANVAAPNKIDTGVTYFNSWPFASSASTGILGISNTQLTGTPGTTENSVCSNRGICDYTTGLCKCFAGYTKGDCSSQNSLAMN